MKDQYTADRRDHVVKQIERQGLLELAVSVGAPIEVLRDLCPPVVRKRRGRGRRGRVRGRLVSGVMLAILLSQGPASAFTKRDILDGLRRWEHGSYCQGMFRRGWIGETIAFFSGC